MSVTFNTASMFASGPSRMLAGPVGAQVVANTTINPATPGRQVIGVIGQVVVVRGRLVADSAAALWSQIDAITAQLTSPPTVAELVDPSGQAFADMSFITFRLQGPFEHGRTVSVPYEATFERLL